MAYTETQGWGSRLVESIKGVLVGIVLFVVAFPLLWWNEGRAVQTAKSLAEGAASVVSVTSLDPANEGKLVHVTGQAATDEVLSDRELGVSAAALRLKRTVEMYQWYEKSASKENLGGSKTTTYTYDKKWSDVVIDSSRFKEAGHTNPSTMRVREIDLQSSRAKLAPSSGAAAFDLAPAVLAKVDKWDVLPSSALSQAKLPAGVRGKLAREGDGLYVGDDPSRPDVGDCRVAYRLVRSPLTMSIVARQTGRGFTPYPAKAGDAILLTATEAKDASSMFTSAEAANETLTWILRGAGWLLMTIGAWLVLRPIAMVVNFVPMAGSFVSFGAFVLAAFASSGLSLLTIAVAWLFYRPLLGVGLLVAAVGGFAVTGVMMARARASAKARRL